jgi:hypothetical protein
MNELKDKVIKDIHEYLESGYINVKDVLKASLQHMEEYEKSLENKRNHLIWEACNRNVLFMLDSKSFNKMKTPQKITFMIDTLFYLAPTGDCQTTAIQKAMDAFKGWCKEENILENKTWTDWFYVKDYDVKSWLQCVLSR